MHEIPPGPWAHENPLSPREREIMELMISGASNPEIAERLVIGQATVKTHVGNILEKLGARNRTHAVALHLRSGAPDTED
jgi:DNA-binding CsgD family transcriptional regulator